MKLLRYLNRPGSVFRESYRRQLAATLTVNIIAFSHGIGLGWVAPMLLQLQSGDSPLSFNISVHEASWIGALISVGGFTGNLIFGIIADKVGRKRCIYFLGVPHICFWIMVYFADNVYYLYIARCLGGFTGGGVYIIIPIFVSEIADCQIRGTLGSMFLFAINIGILSGYIISSHVPYLYIPCIVVVLPVVYLVLLTQFPETPQQLLREGLSEEAEDSLKFYTNFKNTSKEHIQAFTSHLNELKTCAVSNKSAERLSIKDFLNRKSLKAIGMGLFLAFVNIFSGIFCIITYSSMIFAETKSTIDPNVNTITIGAVQILGSYCATFLVDKCGRKILMLVSTSAMCLGLTVIGVHSYLTNIIDMSSLTWLPVVVLSFVIFAGNIGTNAVTFVILVEILPPKIRSLGSSFCLSLLSLILFGLLKIFPILMVIIGLYGVMWMFASVAGLGFIVVLFFLRETKGMSLDNNSVYE